MSEIRIKRFDPTKIRDYSTILFAGGRRSGKSYCMRDFIWYIKQRVYDTHVFSGSIDPEHRWEDYTPKSMVHYCLEEFDEDGMREYMRNQEKRKALSEKFKMDCPPSLVIFEDIAHLTPSIWKDKSIKAMVFNGRWAKSFCFIAIQYMIDMKKGLRGSQDYAVFTLETNSTIRKSIYEQFCAIFPTYGQFEKTYFECTKDHRVMVVDCRAQSYNISDVVFWYKAKDRGTFKIGHPDIWRVYTSKPKKHQTEPTSGKGGKWAETEVKLLGDDEGEWGSDGEWKETSRKKKRKNKKRV